MTAFFLLQGAAVIAETGGAGTGGPEGRRARRLDAPVRLDGAHDLLFFARMERILAFDMAHRI